MSTVAQQPRSGRKAVGIVLWAVLAALAIALLAAILSFKPYNIPSGAMKPTLLIGDNIYVWKFTYGLTPTVRPFFTKDPQRGDVVVFLLPRDQSTVYIKRIVGLPGDRIQMIKGVLNINGTAVKQERVEDFIDDEDGRAVPVKQWRETLPNGVTYKTLDMIENGPGDNTEVYLVPPGNYFMMGDNRDNSADSRYLNQVGYVPFENLLGRAQFIYFSINGEALRSERFGTVVR